MKCKINKSLYKWACSLNKVIISSIIDNGTELSQYTRKLNEFINFQTSEGCLLVPEYLMNQLKLMFFDKHVLNGNCKDYLNSGFFKNYKCKKER